MARDTIVLSPECNGMNRREAASVSGTIQTGTFCTYVDGGVDNATSGAVKLLAVENIATAQDVDYTYAQNENVFMQHLPSGCLVNARVAAATYAVGDVLEIGAGGQLTALVAGTAVAVVPSFATVGVLGAGALLTVELI